MNNAIECKTGELASILRTLIELRMACMIWGGPGIGKSEVIAQVALSLTYPMIDTRLSQIEQVDLRGIPDVDKATGKTKWMTPEFFPTAGEGIWLFDELTSATPSVLAATYQLFNDRMLGEYNVPADWRLIAAGNREGDGGVTYKMPAPLGNRFVHLYVRADANDWVDSYANPMGVDPRIVAAVRSGFLATGGEKQESAVYHFDRANAAFLTPRSLAKCSKVLDAMPESSMARKTIICGLIGLGHGSELCAYLDMQAEFPSLDAIRKDPKSIAVPHSPSVAYAVACAMGRTLDINTVQADFTYLKRITSSDGHELREYRMLVAQDVIARVSKSGEFKNSAIAGHPVFKRELCELAPYMSL